MRFAFLMDPFETLSPQKDTSLCLMRAAESRGHTVYYIEKDGLSLSNDECHITAKPIQPSQDYAFGKSITMSGKEIDCLFIRTDPPFDSSYLNHTWLLSRLSSDTAIINRPSGIRTVNEKLWCTQFRSLIPETLVTYQKEQYKAFLEAQKKLVLKPVDGFGGGGISIVSTEDPNKNVLFELLSKGGRAPVICQSYLEAAQTGDKRILLLNGEPLGAVLRVHSTDDHRNNFFAGGSALKSDLTPRDLEIIACLKPKLIELGLYFVGIDIIGDKLIEVNVTSPTCLVEMMELDGSQADMEIIRFAETLAK